MVKPKKRPPGYTNPCRRNEYPTRLDDKYLAYLLYVYEYMTVEEIEKFFKEKGKEWFDKDHVRKVVQEEHERLTKKVGVIPVWGETVAVSQLRHIAYSYLWHHVNTPNSKNHWNALKYSLEHKIDFFQLGIDNYRPKKKDKPETGIKPENNVNLAKVFGVNQKMYGEPIDGVDEESNEVEGDRESE